MNAPAKTQRKKVVVLHQDSPVRQAARAMCENQIGCVVVSDHHSHVVGIVTDRDLVCHGMADGADSKTPLSSVMSGAPVVAEESTGLDGIIHLMELNGVRRIPIVDRTPGGQQHCIGLVSLDDLISEQRIPLDRAARVIESQMERINRYESDESQTIQLEARRRAHAEQTLNRFYHQLTDSTGLPRDVIPSLTRRLFGYWVQRIHYTEAANLIAQLPLQIQDELLDLPAGPDRSITRECIRDELILGYSLDESQWESWVHRWMEGMQRILDPQLLENARSQLPDDLKSLYALSGADSRKAA